jgi:glutaminyl-peptide cyclotransferase
MFHALTQSLLNFGIEVAAPIILGVLPHDTGAFTQGLAYAHGMLFESTGLSDGTSLRCLDPNTGKVEMMKKFSGYWGEGIAVQGEKIVQLTWQSNRALVYDLSNFTKLHEWSYEGEGWGLAAIQDGYVMTNGTEEILFRDNNFNLITTSIARRKMAGLRWLNDLEYAHGRLFVQRLGDSHVYEIDSQRGIVVRLINGKELIRRADPRKHEEVFNGIAYDWQSDIFYMTGKCWPFIFKVKIPP